MEKPIGYWWVRHKELRRPEIVHHNGDTTNALMGTGVDFYYDKDVEFLEFIPMYTEKP